MLAASGVDVGAAAARSTRPRAPGSSAAFAARWPALARVPWLPGWGDGACSNLGSDCAGPDRVALNVGTSAAIRVVTTAPGAPPARALALPGRPARARSWAAPHRRAATSWPGAGGRSACPTDDRRAGPGPRPPGPPMDTVSPRSRSSPASEAPAGAATRVPRSPGSPSASGPVEIARALLESVACRLAIVFERLEPLAAPGRGRDRVGRRAPPSPLVGGHDGRRPRRPDRGGRGGRSLQPGRRVARPGGAGRPGAAPGTRAGPVVEPDPARHERYRAARERQARLYELVVPPAGS